MFSVGWYNFGKTKFHTVLGLTMTCELSIWEKTVREDCSVIMVVFQSLF